MPPNRHDEAFVPLTSFSLGRRRADLHPTYAFRAAARPARSHADRLAS